MDIKDLQAFLSLRLLGLNKKKVGGSFGALSVSGYQVGLAMS